MTAKLTRSKRAFGAEEQGMSNVYNITPGSDIERLCDHTFLPALLNSGSSVIDLGANRGDFAHGLIQRFGCRVYAAEPLASLQDAIATSPLLKLFHLAIGGEDGAARLHVFKSRCASVLGSRKRKDLVQAEEEVEVVSLRTFLELTKLERVDLRGRRGRGGTGYVRVGSRNRLASNRPDYSRGP